MEKYEILKTKTNGDIRLENTNPIKVDDGYIMLGSGVIDGNVIRIDEKNFFCNGLIPVFKHVYENYNRKKWGYVNTKGEVVVPLIFDNAYNFDGYGLAAVELNGRFGYVNNKGGLVIPCICANEKEYRYRYRCFGNLKIIGINGLNGCINQEGKEIIPCMYESIIPDSKYRICKDIVISLHDDALAAVKLNGKWGYINKEGKEVIPCKYDEIDKEVYNRSSCGNLIPVKLNGKWGLVNMKGEEVIPCQYEEVSYLQEGLIAVAKSQRKITNIFKKLQYGYINQEGKEIIPCKYEKASDFKDGLARIRLKYRYGYINKEGKEIISPSKYDANYFSEGLVDAQQSDYIYYGYLNQEGKEVIPCKYNDAYSFKEGLARIKLNGKWGCINKEGKEVIPCKYDKIDDFDEYGLAKVSIKYELYYLNKEGEKIPHKFEKFGFVNKEGIEVIPCQYDYVEYSSTGAYFPGGIAKVRLDGEKHELFVDEIREKYNFLYDSKYGFINKDGVEIIPCQYDFVDFFSEGLAKVKLNGNQSYINQEGKEVFSCNYESRDSFHEGHAVVCKRHSINGSRFDDKFEYLIIDKTGKEITIKSYDDASYYKLSENGYEKIESKIEYVLKYGDKILSFENADDRERYIEQVDQNLELQETNFINNSENELSHKSKNI